MKKQYIICIILFLVFIIGLPIAIEMGERQYKREYESSLRQIKGVKVVSKEKKQVYSQSFYYITFEKNNEKVTFQCFLEDYQTLNEGTVVDFTYDERNIIKDITFSNLSK